MQEYIYVTGIILKQMPVGEYDRRICMLTKERGKISAFAKGARKPGSKMAAGTNPFSFGTFKLYEGKSSYTIAEADIQNYFEALRMDYIGACYGMYFAEIADYYSRENNDEREMMKLFYQTLRALCAPSIPNRLIRCIYELKAITVNGEFPGLPNRAFDPSSIYTVEYIVTASVEKLYTFTVTEAVLTELEVLCSEICARVIDKEFKSLEILQTLC